MDQQELDLRELFYMLRRRLWMIVTLPLVAAIVAGLVSVYVMEPVYSASTTMWVMKAEGAGQINYNDVLMNQKLTKTYAEVAKSRAVVADVIKTLGLPMTIKDFQEILTVTAVRDTEIISFTVQDTSPEMAARMADAVAAAFQSQIRTFMKVENVVVVDAAMVPLEPIKPRKVMNVAIALVLGGMAAVGLAFLLEYLDTSLKSPEDVTRHIGLPVLGIIPTFEVGEEPATAGDRRQRSRNQKLSTGVEQ